MSKMLNVTSCITDVRCLLVDCGATTHVLNDKDKFVSFDHTFDPAKHFIELADSSRTNNVALAKGDALVNLVDSLMAK